MTLLCLFSGYRQQPPQPLPYLKISACPPRLCFTKAPPGTGTTSAAERPLRPANRPEQPRVNPNPFSFPRLTTRAADLGFWPAESGTNCLQTVKPENHSQLTEATADRTAGEPYQAPLLGSIDRSRNWTPSTGDRRLVPSPFHMRRRRRLNLRRATAAPD